MQVRHDGHRKGTTTTRQSDTAATRRQECQQQENISLASTIEIQLQQHATNTRRNTCVSRMRHD